MDLGIGDISHAIIKTDDLRNRLLSTDVSFTTMFGDKMGYEHNSIVRLSDFRGASIPFIYQPPVIPFSATGGTESNYSNYKVHTFLYDSNNDTNGQTTYTFTTTGDPEYLEFLIVAGGGGGGSNWCAGGGGGGGINAGTSLLFTARD